MHDRVLDISVRASLRAARPVSGVIRSKVHIVDYY